PDALSHLEVEELLALTNKLPPAYKMILNLYAIEGYSHEEIANLLKINVGTSKSNLFKARIFLSKLIAKSKFYILF
ncbi:MAG: sigma factor-like helix-turn-helix DNA-binding protein, partial [Saprospiraceae bacterium]